MLQSGPTPLAPADEPLVSVVVPVYNGEAFLAEALESALSQTHRRLEVLVADNRSVDRSAEIADAFAEQDARVRVHRAQEHVGIRANWNRALRLIDAESRFVKVLSADDALYPACIASQTALAVANPEVALVGGYRVDGDRLGCVGLPVDVGVASGREIGRRALLGGSPIFGAPPNILYRADAVRARDEFYTLPFFNFDDGAALSLLETGDFAFVHQVVSWSRAHAEQETSAVNRLRQWEPGELVLLARYGRRFLTPDELRRRLHDSAGRYSRMLARETAKARPWREPDFGPYHAEALARIGDELAAGGRRREASIARRVGGWLGRIGPATDEPARWVFA